jgi:uncharacterized membrane protein
LNRVSRKASLLVIIVVLFFIAEARVESTLAVDDEYCYSDNLCNSYPIVYQYHDIFIDIQNLDEITVTEDITIKNKQNESFRYFEFWFDQPHSNLTITNGTSALDFIKLPSDIVGLTLSENISTDQTSRFLLHYTYEFDLLVVREHPVFYLLLYYSYMNFFTEEHIVSVRTPSNCFLHEFPEGSHSPFTPANASVNLVGNRILLEWFFENLVPTTIIQFDVFIDGPAQEPLPWWVIFLILVSGLIGGGISVFLFMRRRENRAKKAVGRIYLTDDQQLILKLIYQNEGRISQKELINLTDYSKAKISRNLTTLEDLEMVTKEKWGREFRVYITKEGSRVVE